MGDDIEPPSGPPSGLSQAEAFECFTNPELIRAWRNAAEELRRIGPNSNLVGEYNSDGFYVPNPEYAKKSRARQKYLAASFDALQDFLSLLEHGELLAFGYPEKVPPMGARTRIASDRWALVDARKLFGKGWTKSNIEIGGTQYWDVRVYRMEDLAAWYEGADRAIEMPLTGVWAPSKRKLFDRVAEAYWNLSIELQANIGKRGGVKAVVDELVLILPDAPRSSIERTLREIRKADSASARR